MTEKTLTPKQEAFCIAYIETGNATEAYRRAYEPTTNKEATLNRSAKALVDNPKIASRVSELRAPVIEAAQLTLESHLEELKRLRDAALSAEKYGPAINAEVARGRASGFYVEKVSLQGGLTVVVKDYTGRKKPDVNG